MNAERSINGQRKQNLTEPRPTSNSLPSAISLDAGEDAIEVERVIVPPGGSGSIALYRGTHLLIREVLHFRERDGG